MPSTGDGAPSADSELRVSVVGATFERADNYFLVVEINLGPRYAGHHESQKGRTDVARNTGAPEFKSASFGFLLPADAEPREAHVVVEAYAISVAAAGAGPDARDQVRLVGRAAYPLQYALQKLVSAGRASAALIIINRLEVDNIDVHVGRVKLDMQLLPSQPNPPPPRPSPNARSIAGNGAANGGGAGNGRMPAGSSVSVESPRGRSSRASSHSGDMSPRRNTQTPAVRISSDVLSEPTSPTGHGSNTGSARGRYDAVTPSSPLKMGFQFPATYHPPTVAEAAPRAALSPKDRSLPVSPTSYMAGNFEQAFGGFVSIPSGFREVIMFVHSASNLPTRDGQLPSTFVTAKTEREAAERQPAKAATHAAELSSNPVWEEVLIVHVPEDAVARGEGIRLTVADNVTKRCLTRFDLPVGNLAPYHQYNLDLVAQDVPTAPKLHLTVISRTAVTFPSVKVTFELLLRGYVRMLASHMRMVAAVKIVADGADYKNRVNLGWQHPDKYYLPRVPVIPVIQMQPDASCFDVANFRNRGDLTSTQITLAVGPTNQPQWNHVFTFTEDEAVLFSDRACLVVEYYAVPVGDKPGLEGDPAQRTFAGYSVLPMNENTRRELLDGVVGMEVAAVLGLDSSPDADASVVALDLKLWSGRPGEQAPQTTRSSSKLSNRQKKQLSVDIRRASQDADGAGEQRVLRRSVTGDESRRGESGAATAPVVPANGRPGVANGSMTAAVLPGGMRPLGGLGSPTGAHTNANRMSGEGESMLGAHGRTSPSGRAGAKIMSPTSQFGGDGLPPLDALGSLLPRPSPRGFVGSASARADSNSAADEILGNILSPPIGNSGAPPESIPEVPVDERVAVLLRDIDSKQRLINRLLREVDERTEAVRRVGQDVLQLREQNALLDAANADLRRAMSDRDNAIVEAAHGTELEQLPRDDLVRRIVALSGRYQQEAQRCAEYQQRTQQLQNVLIKKNEAEKRWIELEKAHTAQAAYVQKLQESVGKASKYEQTCKQQEKVIVRLEQIIDKHVKDAHRGGTSSTPFNIEMESRKYLQEENARLREQTRQQQFGAIQATEEGGKTDAGGEAVKLRQELESERQRNARLTSEIELAKMSTAGRMDDDERLMLMLRVDKAESRVAALENEMLSNAKTYAKQISDLKVQLSERKANGLRGGASSVSLDDISQNPPSRGPTPTRMQPVRHGATGAQRRPSPQLYPLNQ
eukprot:Opistho-2@58539